MKIKLRLSYQEALVIQATLEKHMPSKTEKLPRQKSLIYYNVGEVLIHFKKRTVVAPDNNKMGFTFTAAQAMALWLFFEMEQISTGNVWSDIVINQFFWHLDKQLA